MTILTCCNCSSFSQICFGPYMSRNNGNHLGNKVGSTINLNEIVDDTSKPISIIGTKVDLLQSNTDLQNSDNPTDQSSDSENPFQESNVNEVIVKQPINKIKIENVTYQRNLYKKNTVRRISNAINGHINNFRNSLESTSGETSTEGNQ